MRNILNWLKAIYEENLKDKSHSIPFILLTLWSLDTIISVFITGFTRIDGWVLTSILFKCGLFGCNLYFIIHLFIHKKTGLYYNFKTYAGYCIIVVYVTYAFPRMSWELSGVITQTRAIGLWISGFISTLFPLVLYIIFWLQNTQQSWGVETEKNIRLEKKKKDVKVQKRKIGDIIIENLHVLLQAFIIVILIQHFIFQLYVIPSESMVPSILTGDRPFVTKFLSGPAIPLTDWKLPILMKPGRGNIVVFENPHYKQDSLFKKIFHHFVFLATLSLVDIDRDENGYIKKRFIVKRIIGKPGDKLTMIDDRVYIKNETDAEFKPLSGDGKKYAHTDLYDEPSGIKKQIRDLIITEQTRALFDRWDSKKNTARIDQVIDEITKLVKTLQDMFEKLSINEKEQEILFYQCQLKTRIVSAGMESKGFTILSYIPLKNEMREAGMLSYLAHLENDNEMIVFSKYFINNTGIRPDDFSGLTGYMKYGRILNLIYNHLILKKFLRYCEILSEDQPVADVFSDSGMSDITRDIFEFYLYIHFYDYRNFPEFPMGEGSYIPEGSYFLMGDNRYNSMDFRYTQDGYYFKRLDDTDSFSFVYRSQLQPYLLKEEKILGIAIGRLWPLDRFGIIR